MLKMDQGPDAVCASAGWDPYDVWARHIRGRGCVSVPERAVNERWIPAVRLATRLWASLKSVRRVCDDPLP